MKVQALLFCVVAALATAVVALPIDVAVVTSWYHRSTIKVPPKNVKEVAAPRAGIKALQRRFAKE